MLLTTRTVYGLYDFKCGSFLGSPVLQASNYDTPSELSIFVVQGP